MNAQFVRMSSVYHTYTYTLTVSVSNGIFLYIDFVFLCRPERRHKSVCMSSVCLYSVSYECVESDENDRKPYRNMKQNIN